MIAFNSLEIKWRRDWPAQDGIINRFQPAPKSSLHVGQGLSIVRIPGYVVQLSRIVRLGLGGTVSHGRQGISWIHEIDMDRLFERAISDDSMSGPYIATAPNPVSNAEFMREMRKALGAPIGLPAAGWMVRLAAPLILRSDPDLALYGRYCVSRRLQEQGFEFRFPDIHSALQDLYNS